MRYRNNRPSFCDGGALMVVAILMMVVAIVGGC
jgi:cytochrome b